MAFIAEKRNDNAVKLDNGYIPPMLNGINHPLIYAMINDLHGLLAQRSQQSAAGSDSRGVLILPN